MSSVELVQLSFSYSDAVALLSDVSLRLSPGWYSVVGPNGAGKTTLLRLLAGELAPDAGEVRCHPPSLSRGLCPQTVERQGESIPRFASCGERRSQRLLGTLGLDPRDLERWNTLSPGERKRWQIGAALGDEPALLLLDEPTNHLDAEARSLLIDALGRFRGIGVVVSHDRDLLNRLTRDTIRLQAGTLRVWTGHYDAARAVWEAKERERRDAWETLRREQRKLRGRLADRRQRRAEAESRMSTRKRMKGARDSDARARFKAKRRRSAEVGLGREVQLTRRRLERVEREAEGFRFSHRLGGSLFVDYERARVPTLMSIDVPEIRVGERRLLRDVHLSLQRESRVWIVGANGTGKSTLLESLLARATIPAERLLYLPQELEAGQGRALLASVRSLPANERGRVMQMVAVLGVDPEGLLASEDPSPGEARKLLMAYGLGRQVWGLVLDEPTNHLDLPSIERLEGALAAYPGALALVTHDTALASTCTSIRWQLDAGCVRVRTQQQGGEDHA